MSITKEIIIVIDDQPGYQDDIDQFNNSEHSRYEIKLAKTFMDGVNLIQETPTIKLAIIDLSLAFSNDNNFYQDDYGWLLLAILRLHHPKCTSIINSNSSLHFKNLYKALTCLGVDYVCPKEEVPLYKKLNSLNHAEDLELSSEIKLGFKTYLEHNIDKDVIDNEFGISELELVVVEFIQVRKNFPNGTNGKYGAGKFIVTEKKDSTLDRNKISAYLARVKSHIEMQTGKKQEDIKTENIYNLLLQHNMLRKSPMKEASENLDMLKKVASGMPIMDVAELIGVNRRTINRKLNDLAKKLRVSTTNSDGKNSTSQQIATRLIEQISRK